MLSSSLSTLLYNLLRFHPDSIRKLLLRLMNPCAALSEHSGADFPRGQHPAERVRQIRRLCQDRLRACAGLLLAGVAGAGQTCRRAADSTRTPLHFQSRPSPLPPPDTRRSSVSWKPAQLVAVRTRWQLMLFSQVHAYCTMI